MKDRQMPSMSWLRLAGMIVISSAVMFFLMYQLVFASDHLMFSINRLIASLVMAAVMTIVMLAFMWPMYKGTSSKIAVLGVAVVVGVSLLVINRAQVLVGDAAFMRAMIPHHSIAINNARKAHISDPRVRVLADQIIESQVREIEEMKALLEDLRRNGERGQRSLPPRSAEVTPEMREQVRRAIE